MCQTTPLISPTLHQPETGSGEVRSVLPDKPDSKVSPSLVAMAPPPGLPARPGHMLGGAWQASDSHGLCRGTGTRVDSGLGPGADQPSTGLWLIYLRVWFPRRGRRVMRAVYRWCWYYYYHHYYYLPLLPSGKKLNKVCSDSKGNVSVAAARQDAHPGCPVAHFTILLLFLYTKPGPCYGSVS